MAHPPDLSFVLVWNGARGLSRVLFLDRLEHALALSRRRGPGPGVLALDLDGFEQVNDSYGHHAGDVVLLGTAERLSSCVRKSDTCARLGADGFAILLPYSGPQGMHESPPPSNAPLNRRSRSMERTSRFTRASDARSR